MKLIGLMPVRNEAWVLGLSARVALMWVDELIILCHDCTDRSHEIVYEVMAEHPGRVTQLRESGHWDEMRHRQIMLQRARDNDATHIAIIDADEVLTGNLLGLVYGAKDGQILQIPLYNLRNGIQSYHANGLWGNRILSLAFADSPELHWGGDTFHQREPRGKTLVPSRAIEQGEGGVMHLWGASERRLLAKHAMYKVTERLRWPDKDLRQIDFMYSQCVKGGLREDPATWTYKAVPEEWWSPYAHLMKYLDVDAEPWQEQAVRDAVAEHGHAMFAGLDLFGMGIIYMSTPER